MFRFAKFLAPALLLPLAACASPQLRLYEGAAKPAAQVAVITMPEQLEVASINGTEVPGAKGMWNKGDKRLEVLPGRYEALIYYREVWQSAGDSDVLRSRNAALFAIEARPGHRYRIDYEHPTSYEAAKILAQDFRGYVLDETTGQREVSQNSGLKFRSGVLAQVSGDSSLVADSVPGKVESGSPSSVRPLPLAPSVVPAQAAGVRDAAVPAAPAPALRPAPPAGAESRDWVSLMKGWWKQAGADDRRGFLHWIGGEDGRAAAGDWLETIETWWPRASDAQRREFLRWVAEQP